MTEEDKDAQEKLDHLYQEHYEPLCRSAYRIVRDSTYAREVVQDIFVELWSDRHRWSEIRSFKAYLLVSVYRRSLNFVKRRSHLTLLSDDHSTSENTTEQEIEVQELAAWITKAVDSLPRKCKEIFILSREEGLSYKEIASQLGLSVKTVEAQMGIALKKLKQLMEDHERLPPKIFLFLF